ncbi:alpha/beta hydrolase family protein [Candidatus Nitrosocosmicus hydrocola]|uniref:alpha/beta hydrolase family protein n=1 Tax=Candidatus Nitrosocosmicus hydrocola TaxID=1826872 RepID=UPI0011E5D607|nr:alpha/beta fold hydrolase [Candidatus Nitrosocosmicus hydrocola]
MFRYVFKPSIIIFTGLVLITSFSLLMHLSSFHLTLSPFSQVFAQSDIQTVKYRNITLDLGNGVTTNAQLSYPATGKGPFPAVLLVQGSGALDMNETLTKNSKPFWEISQYLSERGFAVLKYDKRGVGESYTILNSNVWGNNTVNDQIQDGKKALGVLSQQPEVDPKRISILGHSEGTLYAPIIAIDKSTEVNNIVLMAVLAQNPLKDVEYYQDVSLPLEYVMQELDKNHTGLISIQQIVLDPFLRNFLLPSSVSHTNDTKAMTTALIKEFGNSSNIHIDKQIKPFLIKGYQNITAFNLDKCDTVGICPILWNSLSNMTTNLSNIGNVSKSIGILILNGENDAQTPVQQAFLLHQRLNEVNHPDHALITYPDLGHAFYPSSKWQTAFGPMEPDVLADLYSWLESHSR